MEPFQALSDKEKEMIEDYVIAYNGTGIIQCSLEHLLRFWNKEKEKLFHFFGDKLILKKTVTITRPEELIIEEMENEFFSGDFMNFRRDLNDVIYAIFKPYSDEKYYMSELMDPETLARNCYSGEDFNIPVPGQEHPIEVRNGCKPMRVLGKMAKAYDIKSFEKFRLAHSLILNQKTLSGTLCLSIHPLDYMTMSDNVCGWESCMSWQGEGEYRLGTVEMMNSPLVVVAYLESDKPMPLSNGEWSNKKWRELVVIDKDRMLLEVKHYPYHNDELGSIVFDWLKEVLPYKYDDKIVYIKNTTTITIEKENEEYNVFFDIMTDAMYNDVYGTHRAYLGDLKDYIDKRYAVNYSGEAECMCCGESFDSGSSDTLLCRHCDGSISCEKCGCYIEDGREYYVNDGTVLCEDCFQDNTTMCDWCEESVWDDGVKDVYLPGKERFVHFCPDCLKLPTLREDLGEIILDDDNDLVLHPNSGKNVDFYF